MYRLGARQIGTQRAEEALSVGDSDRWDSVADIADQDIWELRRSLRELLVLEVRERLRASWRQRGAGTAELGWIDGVLDPDVLTIGFARRVPSYKRLTLMLRDRDRLMDLLLHPDRPVQIVVAGKAHPADDGGKRLIQELVRFADDPRVRHRIVFLPDYGMAMAQKLYPGCDIWLNNPLRPLEACGTSGMKSALNGGLNLSVLDGWWDEWFQPDFGWAIPTADGAGTDPDRRDDIEAAALYDLLEQRVTRVFYERGRSGLPDRWIEMVRRTLSLLGPKVLAGRMVREYVERLYTPAAHAHRAMGPDAARELAEWKATVRGAWQGVTVDHVETSVATATATAELGTTLALRVRVGLGSLRPEDVEVQAVSGRVDEEDRITDATAVALKPVGAPAPGRVGVRGAVVPGPDGAVRLHGTDPAEPSAAGVRRGAGAGGGATGGRRRGGGLTDAVTPAPAGAGVRVPPAPSGRGGAAHLQGAGNCATGPRRAAPGLRQPPALRWPLGALRDSELRGAVCAHPCRPSGTTARRRRLGRALQRRGELRDRAPAGRTRRATVPGTPVAAGGGGCRDRPRPAPDSPPRPGEVRCRRRPGWPGGGGSCRSGAHTPAEAAA